MGSSADYHETDRRVRKLLGPHFEEADQGYIENLVNNAQNSALIEGTHLDDEILKHSGRATPSYGSPRELKR